MELTLTGNPYAPTDAPLAQDSESPPSTFPVAKAIVTSWIATGFTLLVSTLAAALYANGGDVHNLLRSDDHFIGGFAVTLLACGCFVASSCIGWWFGSRRIALWVSVVFLAGASSLMVLSDYLHDFGEGDQFVGALGIGLALGGSAGLLAFGLRRRIALVCGVVLPTLLYAIGFVIALRHMQAI